METYYERSLRSKYRSKGVQTSFYESTPSPTNSLGDQISSGSTRSLGQAGANLPYAPKERHSRGASRFCRFLFKRIPGTEIFRRVGAGYRSKESKPPQDAYFHVPIHPNSRKYLRSAFENRVYQFQVLPFGLNTAPQGFTRLGNMVTAYLHHQGISVIPYLDDWLIHHPDRQVLLQHQAQLINTLDLVGFILNRRKSELDLTQDLQFLGIRLRLDIGKALLPESKAWEIVARAHHLSSLRVLNYTQVSQLMGSLNRASGLIRMGHLYLRLETQNIIVWARHIPGCLNMIADHLPRPNQPIPTEWSLHPEIVERIFRVWGTPEVDMFANTVELPTSSVHVSNSGAKSPSGGCSVSGLAGDVNVHVSPIPPAQQNHAEASVDSGGGGNSRSPLVAVSVVVSTSTTSLCGTPSSSPLPSGSSVPAGPEVHLRRKVVPSARMEALLRHYKAAGFSDEVSRLAAAPRKPSTNRMYDDRWLRFARWAAGQGFNSLDPTAAQIASFYLISLILMVCCPKL